MWVRVVVHGAIKFSKSRGDLQERLSLLIDRMVAVMKASIKFSKPSSKLGAVEEDLKNRINVTSIPEIKEARIGRISQLPLTRL